MCRSQTAGHIVPMIPIGPQLRLRSTKAVAAPPLRPKNPRVSGIEPKVYQQKTMLKGKSPLLGTFAYNNRRALDELYADHKIEKKYVELFQVQLRDKDGRVIFDGPKQREKARALFWRDMQNYRRRFGRRNGKGIAWNP